MSLKTELTTAWPFSSDEWTLVDWFPFQKRLQPLLRNALCLSSSWEGMKSCSTTSRALDPVRPMLADMWVQFMLQADKKKG